MLKAFRGIVPFGGGFASFVWLGTDLFALLALRFLYELDQQSGTRDQNWTQELLDEVVCVLIGELTV